MRPNPRLNRRAFLRRTSAAAIPFAVPGLRAAPAAAPPAPAPGPPEFDSLTPEQRVGQLVIARQPDWLRMEDYARRGWIAGMTPSLTRLEPAEVAEFTNRFQRLSLFPLLFGWAGVSYRGGTELRLNQAMRLGATRDAALCREAGRIEAMEARALGFQLGGAPVLDVNLNPDNTIINLRSIGDDPALVTRLGAEIARGTIEGGAASILMHFPGHGATRGDSHIEMPEANRTLAQLETVELAPFTELIRRGLARVICTNHCHYPAFEPERKIPATFSRRIVTGLLREQLRYDGVIMSDSLTMRPIKDEFGIEEGAIRAVEAGHDLILQDAGSDPKITIDALTRAVRQGRIAPAQIAASARRVWRLKRDLGLFERRLVDPENVTRVFASAASADVARRIARRAVTLLENRGGPLRAGAAGTLAVISNGSETTIDRDTTMRHSPGNEQFNRRIRERVPDTRALVLSTDMRREELDAAADAARGADSIVFGIFTRVRSYVEDAIRVPPPYRALIERIAAGGRPVALLNFGNPYVMSELPRAAFALCTFSDAPHSIDAAVETLFGELHPAGALPVRISESYPFGHGLKT